MVADAPDNRPGREQDGDEEEAASGPQQIRLQRVADHCGSYGMAAGALGDRRDSPGGQAGDRCGGEAGNEYRPATRARRAVRAAPAPR
jgi:hypothetical protein